MILAASLILSAALLPPRPVPASPRLIAGGVGGVVFYVDDDHPGDPGPGNPLLSNPLEDGSAYYPFDSVQEALDRCASADTIQIEAGLYTESLTVRGSGCRLVGRGQGVTILAAASPELLTRHGNGVVNLGMGQMTLRGGSVSVTQDAFQQQGSFRMADVAIEGTELRVYALDSLIELEMEGLTAQGGRIQLFPGIYGSIASRITNLIAPDTRIEFDTGTAGRGSLEVEDSVIAGIVLAPYSEAVASATIRRVRLTRDGIWVGSSGARFLEILCEDLIFEGSGFSFSAHPRDFDFEVLASAVIVRSKFLQGGASFSVSAQNDRALAHASDYALGVYSSQFASEGISFGISGGIESLSVSSSLVVQNNTVKSAGTAFEAYFGIDVDPDGTTDLIESQLEIVNNTFTGNDTGIRLTTTPHTPGLHSLETLIKNNIIAGGRTGIEVRGLDDHTITVENNDVLGRPDGRYRGDLPDQTGRNGNISLPPWFRGPNDFRLQRISPCIDRGGFGPEVPGTDIDGRARPLDGNGDGFIAPDMGAYELPGLPDRPAGNTKPKSLP